MGSLHAAYEALGGAEGPIEFVSLSMDNEADDVVTFRRDRWPMPWRHAHVPPAEHAALHEAWEFEGVPLLVLVDSAGDIAAIESSLRGELLLPTLRAFVDSRSRE